MATRLIPPGYGQPNFRPTLAEREAAKRDRRSAQQRRPGNDEKHLDAIRKTICCGCGRAGPNDPHHLKSGAARAERSVGRRATDRWAVPLCRTCHDAVERAGGRGEVSLFRSWGVADVQELASALWSAPKDGSAMTAIVTAHRTMGAR